MSFTRDNVPARRSAQLFACLCLAVGAVAVAAMFTTAPVNALIAIASFVPLIVIAMLLGLFVSLVFRRWILLCASVVVLAVVAAVIGPLYVADGRAAEGPAVRVLQANLLFGQADPRGVTGSVRDQAIDVLTVQELTDALAIDLKNEGLETLLPYRYLRPDVSGGGGAGIYSRYPLANTRELEGFGPTNLVADVGFVAPFTLVAVHPGPAYITPPDIWTAELKNLRTELTKLSETANPVVVSGDFNTTYLHQQFRDLLSAGYSDAADQLGSGIVPTYPADKQYPALVGIDHVLMKDASAQSLERVTVEGSDHYGLVVELSVGRD